MNCIGLRLLTKGGYSAEPQQPPRYLGDLNSCHLVQQYSGEFQALESGPGLMGHGVGATVQVLGPAIYQISQEKEQGRVSREQVVINRQSGSQPPLSSN